MAELNTYGDISPRTAAFAAKRLLARGQHILVFERWGQVDPQGQNKTKSRSYRRYESLPRAIAPLAEGIPPTGQQLTFTDVTINLEQYGDSVQLTDVIEDTHEDSVLNESMDLVGEQAAETIEVVRYNILKAGTNVFYANAAANRAAVNSAPLRGDLRRIFRSFKRAKGREFTRIVKASPAVSTEPVGTAYWAVGHTDLDSDIKDIAGFTPVEQYSNSSKALEGEIGKLENFRIVLTALADPFLEAGLSGSTFLTNGSSGTGQPDVYPLLCFARNSYAIVPLQGDNAVTPIVLNPNKPSPSDPLGQVGFVSWKMWQGAGILNQTWMARYECAATANPS